MELSFADEFKRSWLTSLIGLILYLGGIWLLTWNEGRAVHHAHSLEEAYNNVISLNPYEPLQEELDGRLVHISGPLLIDEPLTEPEYGISIQTVKLKRRVQMYQWVEERVQLDYGNPADPQHSDNSDYFYVTEWRDKLVDSRNFYIRHGHQNPNDISIKSHVHISPLVKIGPLILGAELKDKFTDYIEVTSDERPENRDIKLHLGIYYYCEDVWNPEVGDIRVQFYYAGLSGEPVSIIALQQQASLVPYLTTKGREILLLRQGSLSVLEMFDEERADAHFETWKLRAAGVFIVYASSVCLARLLKIIFFRLPYMRAFTSSEMSSSTNLAFSVSVSLLVISTAWIMYRPWLGAALFMAAISPFFYCTMGMYNAVHH